ncbi:MAG: hypothetical protein WD063_04710 [Pirellulales bacterium]
MIRRFIRYGRPAGAALAVWLAATAACAAPRIDKVSLLGLQAGGITTLVIEGADLLPEPRILFSAPNVKHTIKDGATGQRLEVEFVVEGGCESGIYLLRVASAGGISQAVALGVDNLPQIPFAPELATLNVALTGALAGSTVLATSFAGKQGQQVLVEVESRRLGSKLNPVVHVYDSRHTQLCFSRGLPSIAGDARALAILPADGRYTIELHDDLYRGGEPGFFRLKIGEFRYADLAYPLGVEKGTTATFEFASTNLPADARSSGTLATADGLSRDTAAAPWPADVAMLSGSRPAVIVTDHAEIVEAAPSDKLQEVPAAPVAINGRIAENSQQDRYRLTVTPGENLRFDVLARRAGSPLDGVLSIQNEQGAELAGNDDRPGTSDPGLDFKVPADVKAVIVGLVDLHGHGGADFIYRIAIGPAGGPDFTLSLPTDRVAVPKDGTALMRVQVNRAGYSGPIKLSFPNLPASVSVAGDEIPAQATEAFVTLSAPGLSPAQSLSRVLGTSAEGNVEIKRQVSLPENEVTKHQPWLGDEVAVAVTNPGPLALVWEPLESDAKLALGAALAAKLRVQRAEGTKGAVRLSLLTTQRTPRKKIKENNLEREVDDVERALRFEAAPLIAADASEAAANILVPGDLPRIAYDLAIGAELLGDDNKSVIASAVTPARRMTTALPISVELFAEAVAARAGLGPTGKVAGTIKRAAGFALPVNVTLSGLPEGTSAPIVTLVGGESKFEFPLTFPFGTSPGELKDVKVSATSLTDPKNPKSVFRAGEVPLSVVVVSGEKPPDEKPAEGKPAAK